MAGENEYEFLPEDISALDRDALDAKETEALAAFDALRPNAKTAEDLANLQTLASDVERIRTRLGELDEDDAKVAADLAALDEKVRPKAEEAPEPGAEPDDGESVEGGDEGEGDDEGADAPAESVAASGKKKINAKDTLRPKGPRKLNVPMSEIRKNAPEPTTPAEPIASIVAAANIPGYPAGGKIDTIRAISEAASARTRVMPKDGRSGEQLIAQIDRQYDQVLNPDSTPEAVETAVAAASDPELLVAAGGWCAPSQIIYDFFNISCVDGLVDLPTIGIERGGVRFPVSPSIASVLSDIWLWTESDDILAVTGVGTKPCARPACPTFTDERLDCHGLCVTAGNLTERAYPELIDNHIRMTMDAHSHIISQRNILELVAGSTTVAMTSGTATELSVSWGLLNAIDLQVQDYKLKFRMCDSDVLEVVLPWWARAMVRADIAKRNGYADPFNVPYSEMANWFDQRSVRAQFVQDWQAGSGAFPGQTTPRTDWPTQLSFLLYAAGTWVKGGGPTIDLGVVRDSALNAKNDHTAAWTEECNLIAKFGHESRLVNLAVDVSGTTGLQADISDHP